MQQKNIPVVRIAERTVGQSLRLALGILILVALTCLILYAAIGADRDMERSNREAANLEARAAAAGVSLVPTDDEVGPHHLAPHRTHTAK